MKIKCLRDIYDFKTGETYEITEEKTFGANVRVDECEEYYLTYTDINKFFEKVACKHCKIFKDLKYNYCAMCGERVVR